MKVTPAWRKRGLTPLQESALGRGGIEGLERAEAIHEANSEALAQMVNEAREDAIEMAKTLRECVEAFKAIRDAATIPGVGLPSDVAEALRLAWTHSVMALKGHVEANRNSGWDSSTWPELGR
jgi:hypothetical protein